ncbi:hypothetical protein FACS1894172_00120 [Spirochaetia bacterium]|nr:hypothetical protein FACS1894164_06540 [Spirochaetia bacterium]GHU29302.1 hypothetical protein FACS1894172_00120 [Spirochaetia bacterium]
MRFVWDPKKNEEHIRKHSVSFEQALYVYSDPNRLTLYDSVHSFDENRWVLIGNANGHILFVIEAEANEDDTVLIVSARKAIKREQEQYVNS